MNKVFLFLICMTAYSHLKAQDSTSFTAFDPSQFEDSKGVRKFCTQSVLNQTPTKLYGIGYEHNLGFKSSNGIDKSHNISSMGGLRITTSLLAISKNNLILSLGLSSWSSNIRSTYSPTNNSMRQLYKNGMELESFNVLMFKPLNEKNFLIAQGNIDMATIDNAGDWAFTKSGLTFYGSAIYGWKKGDYRMLGVGLSRTYRLGRPLIVPVLLYNETFDDNWGIESLWPARAHLRYNFSTNALLLAGYELEGQQFDFVNSNQFLQRGEIKPRIVFERKLKGFFWLSAQAGYRINGRFNLVNKYDGQEKDELLKNKWGSSPYFNLSIYFVSP